MGMTWHRKARRLAWERFARSLRCWVPSTQCRSAAAVNRTRGSSSRTIRYACGRVIWGIFFPPLLLQRQQEGAGQQADHDMVVPAPPGAHLVFVQPHIALPGLELRLDWPT